MDRPDWKVQADSMGVPEGEIAAIEAEVQGAAVMASRVLAEHLDVPELLEKLQADLTRHHEHPLAYGSQLLVAYALAVGATLTGLDAGSEARLAEYGVHPEEDEEDDDGS